MRNAETNCHSRRVFSRSHGMKHVQLYAWREGDANMQSVWLCTRNDVIGNVAVIVAAITVWASGTGLADVVVAMLMGGLAVHSGSRVMRLAHTEMQY